MQRSSALGFIYLSLILFTFIPAQAAVAGGMTSSGGEYITTERNPWFVGSKPITYCIRRSDSFSMPTDVAGRLVREAFTDWIGTLNALVPAPTEFTLPDGELKTLTLEAIEVDCAPSRPELVFDLGEIDPTIEAALEHMARYTAAFTGRTSYDESTGRAQGVIWLAADRGPSVYQGPAQSNFWSQESVLYDVLLHEIGHVFGFQHQQDGIMSESFPTQAIASGIGSKLSSRSFASARWFETGTQVCGQVLQDPSLPLGAVFGLKLPQAFAACLNPGKSPGLSLATQEGLPLGNFPMALDGGELVRASMRSLSGEYFEDRLKPVPDYRHHDFVEFHDSRQTGTLLVKGVRLPLMVETRSASPEITLVKGVRFFTIPLISR